MTFCHFARTLVFTLLIGIAASGCDGGLIGTSTGPKAEGEYQLTHLPSRISPRLPAVLTQTTANANRYKRSIAQFHAQAASQSWQLLAPPFSKVESDRMAIQQVLTLLDSVLLDTVHLCDASVSSCQIQAGALRVEYSEPVIRQLQLLAGNDFIGGNNVSFEHLAGTQLEFGAVFYSRLDTGLHDFLLEVESPDLLPGRHLELKWSADGREVSYKLGLISDPGLVDQYRYQHLVSGQRLTLHSSASIFTGDTDFEIEITADGNHTGNILYSARFDEYTVNGRASDDAAYAATLDFTLGADDSVLLQEEFTLHGELTQSHVCEQLDDVVDCGLTELNSEFFISPAEVGETELALGFGAVVVVGLPDSVAEFDIRQRLAGDAALAGETYCHGFHYPENPVFDEVYCFVDEALLQDAIVVSFDDGGTEYIVEQADIILSDPYPLQ